MLWMYTVHMSFHHLISKYMQQHVRVMKHGCPTWIKYLWYTHTPWWLDNHFIKERQVRIIQETLIDVRWAEHCVQNGCGEGDECGDAAAEDHQHHDLHHHVLGDRWQQQLSITGCPTNDLTLWFCYFVSLLLLMLIAKVRIVLTKFRTFATR